MALNTKTFTRLVQDWVAAVQGASTTLLDFTIGSILRAIAEAQGGVALWLQGLILKLLSATRLGTSSGSDVDSFVADFGLTRLPAVPASGQVTFSRFTATNAAFIPAQVGVVSPSGPTGALIQTADGTQTFFVVADTNQAAYSSSLGGYVVPANTASITATVQALLPGSPGNVAPATLTVLQTGISGVDTVTNVSAFTNGVDEESDAAVKTRFVAYMNSLSKGTVGAFGYAITSLRQGLQHQIIEDKDYGGTTDYGMVTVIVDDGSGHIADALVTAVYDAIFAIRAAGVRIGVFAATTLTANVTATISVGGGYTPGIVQSQVQLAVIAALNGVGLGNAFDYMKLGQVIYDASTGVTGVGSVTLNSGTSDLIATKLQTIKAGTVTINLAS